MSDVFTNQEVLVAHANARLNVHGRRLLITRVLINNRPVAHVYTGAASAPYDLYVRYSACDGNGTDDGTTRRTLTRDVRGALFDDPVLINGLTGATGAICPDDAWQ